VAKTFLPAAVLLIAAQTQLPVPGFKAQVTVVEVDVVVIDKSGRPVQGLRQEDFSISEDGSPVEIATFSAIDVPDARPPVVPAPDRSGSAFASNEQADDGRLMLIVLDDIQVGVTAGRMATVKSVARRAVERLGPSDVAAVMTTSGARGGQAEFTMDKRRLLEAIDQFRPRGEDDLPAIARAPSLSDGAMDTGGLAARRTVSTMAGLSVAARALATIPHRRKGVLLVSQGFPAPLDQIIRDPAIGAGWDSIREFLVTAQRSNVAVYTVDPCGLEHDPGCSRDSRLNLRTLAERTGGFAVTDTNAPEAGIDRMLAENGTYYLIGYYSPALPNDGKHHRIAVRTPVADLEIRAREGYESPGKPRKVPTPTPLEALTRSVLQTRGLTMRVVAIPAPLPTGPSATVIVGIELPTAAATTAGRVEFAMDAIDQEGKTHARVRFSTDFAAAGKTAMPWTRTGSRIDLAPGRYQIRVAAVGGDASQGSVFTDVSVPKFDAGLGVGGLSLGAPTSIAATGADRLRSALALIPFATNELAPGTAVTAQLPIRTASKIAAERLTITARVMRADGTRLELDRTQAAASDYGSAAGKVYQVALPQGLGAGTYRLIVDTTLGSTTIAREVGFSVLAHGAH
jgi:VWFA-related protein